MGNSKQVYSIRIPPGRLAEIRTLAEQKGIPTSTMVVNWISEQLDLEDEMTTPWGMIGMTFDEYMLNQHPAWYPEWKD